MEVQRRSEPLVMLEIDPSKTFCEETSFLFHDPKTSGDCKSMRLYEEPLDELPKLPPPEERPMYGAGLMTQNRKIRFQYRDPKNRVLDVDFTNIPRHELSVSDLRDYAKVLERDDITVVSKGLFEASKRKPGLWDLRGIQTESGDRVHHKFKRFVRTEDRAIFKEEDYMLEGSIGTYIDYLDSHAKQSSQDNTQNAHSDIGQREPHINQEQEGKEDSSNNENRQPFEFDFKDDEGKRVEINVDKDVLYMIDLDLPRIFPANYDDFVGNFKVKEILPGGEWCMMNGLPQSARPFMGPNMYITPGGSYTQLHQDGNGTVDSGHCVLSGYNEVVMLRRLPERHKDHASKLMPNRGEYDALYNFPHENGKKPDWPTNETVQAWEDMGYEPAVLILGPGQHVHINKGRLHAFRKMTTESLPENDCHHTLRKELVAELGIRQAPVCISIAWDWQYTGIRPEAINREVTSTLECQTLVDQKPLLKCLAIPKACILALARRCQRIDNQDAMPIFEDGSTSEEEEVLQKESLLKGIGPSLLFILEQNISFIERAEKRENEIIDEFGELCGYAKLSNAKQNDTELNPLSSTVDPDGNDYFCRICSKELENVYLHCDGCEDLLHQDFNICMDCYDAKRWQENIDMHGKGLDEENRSSMMNHTGKHGLGQSRASCGCTSQFRLCQDCGMCSGCACFCHSWFTVRRRFYDKQALKKLADWARRRVGTEPYQYAELTKHRLLIAADRSGAGLIAKRDLLKSYPNNTAAALKKNRRDESPSGTISTSATPSISSENEHFAAPGEKNPQGILHGDVTGESTITCIDRLDRKENTNGSDSAGSSALMKHNKASCSDDNTKERQANEVNPLVDNTSGTLDIEAADGSRPLGAEDECGGNYDLRDKQDMEVDADVVGKSDLTENPGDSGSTSIPHQELNYSQSGHAIDAEQSRERNVISKDSSCAALLLESEAQKETIDGINDNIPFKEVTRDESVPDKVDQQPQTEASEDGREDLRGVRGIQEMPQIFATGDQDPLLFKCDKQSSVGVSKQGISAPDKPEVQPSGGKSVADHHPSQTSGLSNHKGSDGVDANTSTCPSPAAHGDALNDKATAPRTACSVTTPVQINAIAPNKVANAIGKHKDQESIGKTVDSTLVYKHNAASSINTSNSSFAVGKLPHRCGEATDSEPGQSTILSGDVPLARDIHNAQGQGEDVPVARDIHNAQAQGEDQSVSPDESQKPSKDETSLESQHCFHAAIQSDQGENMTAQDDAPAQRRRGRPIRKKRKVQEKRRSSKRVRGHDPDERDGGSRDEEREEPNRSSSSGFKSKKSEPDETSNGLPPISDYTEITTVQNPQDFPVISALCLARPRKSPWWLAFRVNQDGSKYYCNTCGEENVYITPAGTKQLRAHLSAYHRNVFDYVAKNSKDCLLEIVDKLIAENAASEPQKDDGTASLPVDSRDTPVENTHSTLKEPSADSTSKRRAV
uniref:JmjC domain-containing protein n=1 Tax=Entomoneis paludosa TaxID=265537 RepID=A0A7S2YQT9_9STRA|mmetsp:Transcript_6367/g.13266  ORF Transcript_6367/g.13266 Transcript_6367/m.13266 type:complete len:1466 (+) Transcript_6367:2-4399(+)